MADIIYFNDVKFLRLYENLLFQRFAKQANQANRAQPGDKYQRNTKKDLEWGHQGCWIY